MAFGQCVPRSIRRPRRCRVLRRALPVAAVCPSKRRPDGGGLRMLGRRSDRQWSADGRALRVGTSLRPRRPESRDNVSGRAPATAEHFRPDRISSSGLRSRHRPARSAPAILRSAPAGEDSVPRRFSVHRERSGVQRAVSGTLHVLSGVRLLPRNVQSSLSRAFQKPSRPQLIALDVQRNSESAQPAACRALPDGSRTVSCREFAHRYRRVAQRFIDGVLPILLLLQSGAAGARNNGWRAACFQGF